AEPDTARGRGREHRVDVVGGREQDADDVVLVDVVALQHAGDERLDALGHLLGGVAVDSRGTPQGPNGGWHRGGSLLRASGSTRPSVSASRRPTGKTLGSSGTSSTTVGRPWVSAAVVTTPAGLLSR